MRFLQKKSLFFFIRYTMLVWLPGSTVFSQTTIDTYTTNQATLSAPPSASSNSTGGGDIIGTRRGLVVNHLSGPGVTTAGVAGGGLNFNVAATTPDSRGEVVNTWDGDTNPGTLSPAGLGGVNLTSGGNNAFRLNIFSATAGTEIVLDVYTDGSNASRGAFVLPTVTAPTDFYLNFSSDFISTLGTGANFANVGAILLTVRGTEVSCSINQIVVTFNPPNIPAPTQTDQLLLDNGSPGNADAGDKIQYKVNIQNTGSAPATGVQLNVAPDPRTTFVPGSFRSSPLAVPDVYACTGNVGLNVPAASGVKANDFDDNPAGLTITAGTFATTKGGSIMLNADGSFMYTPPAGFTGTDTYSYTLNDANGVGAPVPTTDPGLITITVSNLIWFVDNSVAGPGTGTLSDPFKTLTSAATASAVGQVIFVKNTGTNYSTGITLKNNQYLFGSGHLGGTNLADAGVLPFTVAANSKTLPAIGGTRPIITGPTNGITLASGNTIRGVEVGRCGTMKISGSNFGTLTIGNSTTPDVALSGNISALSLSNGVFAATSKFASISSGDSSTTAISLNTVSGTLASNSTTIGQLSAGNIGIDIQNSSATLNFGTTTITKITNSTVAAITITNSGTGTVAFGSLAITSNSTGLLANNGGTLQISGVTNTISTNQGPALDITSTSFGAGATFSTISCTANIAVKGVNLDNVSGNLTVTGGTLNMGGSAGIGLDVNAGTGNISYGGNVAYAAANRTVEVTGRTGNTATFSGNINTTSGTGINVANNTGGTIDFSGATKSLSTGANTAVTVATNTGATINFTGGGLIINTTTGTGFSGTGGGTVNVGTGATNNNVTTTGAKAINLDGVLTDITFASVTAANIPTEGINLNNLSSASSFKIPGAITLGMAAGSNANVNISGCSNCTIDLGTNGTTHNAVALNARRSSGIILNNVSGTVRFGNVTAPNPNSVTVPGIRSTNCAGVVSFAQANVDMNSAGSFETFSNDTTPDDNNGNGDAVYISGFTGTGFSINGGRIENAADDGIDIRNSSNFNLSGVIIEDCGLNPAIQATTGHNSSCLQALNLAGTNNMTGSTFQRGGLRNFYITQTTGTTTLNIGNTCVFDDIRTSGSTIATDNMQVYLDNSATASIDIENSSFLRSRTHQINVVTLGNSVLTKLDITGITMDNQGGPSSGINIDFGGASTANFNIMNNVKLHAQDENCITVAANGTAQVQGRIKDNPNMRFSTGSSGGSIFGNIRVTNDGTSSVITILIDNNSMVLDNGTDGINVNVQGAANATINATINANTVNATGTAGIPLEAINAFTNPTVGVAKLIRLNITNNTVTGIWARALRARALSATGLQFVNFTTDVLTTWNNNGNMGSPVAQFEMGGTIGGTASCPTPSNPLP